MDRLWRLSSCRDNHSVDPYPTSFRECRLRLLLLGLYASIRSTTLCEYVVRLSRNGHISYGLESPVVALIPRDLCDRHRDCDFFDAMLRYVVSHGSLASQFVLQNSLKRIYEETWLVDKMRHTIMVPRYASS